MTNLNCFEILLKAFTRSATKVLFYKRTVGGNRLF
jgi:hypothetical protein